MTDTAKLNLYQKILKITEEIGMIEKTGRNTMQNYAFIEQAQVVAELRPQLSKWGVVIMPETVSRRVERYDVVRSNGKAATDIHANVVSRYTVINTDNPDERFTCEWDAGEAIDSGDKATNKATTASHKYFLMKLFNISDKEDADQDSPEAAPAKNYTQPTSTPQSSDWPASPAQRKFVADLLTQNDIPEEEQAGYLTGTLGLKVPLTSEGAKFAIEELKRTVKHTVAV